jgi:hypothetical protein
MNCHPQGVFIKEVQVLTASKYVTGGFTVGIFTHVTIFNVQLHETIKSKLNNNTTRLK